MSNITGSYRTYLLFIKAMARVGWWMQRPLIRIQQEAMRHPINVSDEEVEEYLAVNRERLGSDTLSNRSRPRDYWGCSDECGPGHTRNKGCALYEQALQQAHDETFGTRTLDVSTEDIKSWPKVKPSRERRLERLVSGRVLPYDGDDLRDDREVFDQHVGTPVEQTMNTHGLLTMQRITEPSHSKDWGPLIRFVAHCHCGWDSGQCYPRDVATQAHADHRAAHNDNVADYGIGQTKD